MNLERAFQKETLGHFTGKHGIISLFAQRDMAFGGFEYFYP